MSVCDLAGTVAIWRKHAPLLRAFYWQSLQQMVLTEAEKFALWFGASGFEQGTFAVVSNLGSLVARLVFLPVEETSKAVFQRETDRRRSAQVLELLVKLVALIGLVAAAFGPAYSRALLHLLYGERISASGAPQVLQFYSVYILFMAVNGVSEAFVHATADQTQLRVVSATMLAISAVYIVLASALLHTLGTVGLVVANCVNMAMRITFSTVYALRRFSSGGDVQFSVRRCLPSAALALAFLSAIVVTQISRTWIEPRSLVLHIGIGALVFGAVLGVAFVTEKQFVRDLRAVASKKQD
jgi:oligosaccharide translocation protein RFT1